jgi:Protein of unknown function (DUF2934)
VWSNVPTVRSTRELLKNLHHDLAETNQMADRDHLVIQAIANRAFELHESAGSHHGRDHDDWFQAERELTSQSYVEIDGLALMIQIPIDAESRTHILASISPWSILLLTVPAASEVDSCVEPDLRDLVRYISLPREVVPEEVMTSLDEHGLGLRLPIALERSILPSCRSDRFRDTTGRT